MSDSFSHGESPVPLVTGAAGLTGRPLVVRIPDLEEEALDEFGNPVPKDPVVAQMKTIPPTCLHRLTSFRDPGCTMNCPGEQVHAGGGCLVDIVRRANELGVEWEFAVRLDPHGNQEWTYCGPDLEAVPEPLSATEKPEEPEDGVYGVPV